MSADTEVDRQMVAVYFWPATKARLLDMAKLKHYKGISPFVCDYLDELAAQSTDELGDEPPPTRRRAEKRNKVRVYLNLQATTRSRLEAMSLKTPEQYSLDPYIEQLLENLVKESRAR